jgi:hypothetical protein
MIGAERALLLAVRDTLRDSPYSFAETECEIEFDEMTPATVGQHYLAVMPGGWRPGPRHDSCGGVNDLVYGVDVLVIKRITNVPRDRRRNVFIDQLGSLDALIDKVYQAVDFKYGLLDTANGTIAVETGSLEGFVEPLKFSYVDKRPRLAPAELFSGAKDNAAGMMRLVSFTGARRLTHK